MPKPNRSLEVHASVLDDASERAKREAECLLAAATADELEAAKVARKSPARAEYLRARARHRRVLARDRGWLECVAATDFNL